MPRLKVHYGCWVMVGDGRRALFFKNDGDAEILNLRRQDVRENADAATQSQVAPLAREASATERAVAVSETGWHQVEEERFARSIAEQLNQAAREQKFRDLIIVAPPKVLAEIRRDLSAEAHRRVAAEIPKDLVHHTIPEIETILSGTMLD